MFVVTKVFNEGYSLEILDTRDGQAEIIRVKDLVNYLNNGVISLESMDTFERVTSGEGVYSFDIEGIDGIHHYIIKVYFGMYSAIEVKAPEVAVAEGVSRKLTGVVPPEPGTEEESEEDAERIEEELEESEESEEMEELEESDEPEEAETELEVEELEAEEPEPDEPEEAETELEVEELEETTPIADASIIENGADEAEDISGQAVVTTSNDEVSNEEVENITSEDGEEELAGVLTSLGLSKQGTRSSIKSEDSSIEVKTSSIGAVSANNTDASVEDGSTLLKTITGNKKKNSKIATTKVASKNKANGKTSARKTTFSEGKKKFLVYLGYESSGEKRLVSEADLKLFAKAVIIGANNTFTKFTAVFKRGKNKGKYISILVDDSAVGFRSNSDIPYKDKVLKAADRLLSGYVNVKAKATTLYKICSTSSVEQIDYSEFDSTHREDMLYTMIIVVTDNKDILSTLK